MLKSNFFICTLLYAAIAITSCQTDNADNPWPEQSPETKPWTRMWWMGNSVNKTDIALLMKEYSETGLGGIEITPIYGVTGYEDQNISFLSEEWMDILNFTIEEAEKNGMKADINLGTGWPYGGPHVTPQHGAKRLIISRMANDQGKDINPDILLKEGDSLLAFFSVAADGSRKDLIAGGNNIEEIIANHEIYYAVSRNTNQLVKRAAPGGEGLTVDPFSQTALLAYLDRFDKAFGEATPSVRSMFNDSYEVYAASFSPLLFDEFEKRRGYDVRPYIKELSEREATPINIRIQGDYRETISDLLLEEFTIPWNSWIEGKNSISRLQAHGSPGNLLDLYAAAGIPEGEIFGSSTFPVKGFRKYTDDTRNPEPDPMMMKFASSAANITGKKLVSSETFTWGGEHFKVSLAELKPALEQVLLGGVNHIFYHGTAYSPQDAPWPGWLFYASVQFNPQNSFWPHLKGMNEYITRCQSVLQDGKSDNELLVYWPVHDIWHRTGNPDMLLTVHNIGDWLQPSAFYSTVKELTENGYSADFISGRQLNGSVADENGISANRQSLPYKALVIPAVGYMPVEDMENILRLAQEGAVVIFTGLPSDVAGFHEYEQKRRDLTAMIESLDFSETESGLKEYETGTGSVFLTENPKPALEYRGIFRENLADNGLKFIRRDHGDGKYYFVVNHTDSDIDTVITINCNGKSAVLMDPLNGKWGLADRKSTGTGTSLRLQIASGQSLFIKTSQLANRNLVKWNYYVETDHSIDLDQEWTLSFAAGGPVLPDLRILDKVQPWTSLPGQEVERFSGSAEYFTELYLPELAADEYVLCLGDVRESARVWVNGHDAGIVWANPFRINVGEYLDEWVNTFRIEVANLMANRIRDMDRQGEKWRIFKDINFVSLFYTPFDASDWDVIESGLGGPVRLIPMTGGHSR
jgi:hypothetical protein